MLTYHRNQGVDDILAMLLAFSAKAEEIEVLLIGVTFGNVEVERYVTCLVRIFCCYWNILRNWSLLKDFFEIMLSDAADNSLLTMLCEQLSKECCYSVSSD